MKKSIKKFIQILKLDNYEYFKFSAIFILLVYISIPIISILVGIIFFLAKRKWIYVLLISLLLIEVSYSKLTVINTNENYSLLQYKNDIYYSRQKNLVFGDEIDAEYELKYLEESDFNTFLINRGVNQEIIFKKMINITPSYHPKAVLYRYIKHRVDIENQPFILSIFFNYKFKSFIFYSLQYPVLLIILQIKKINKKLALLFCGLFLLLDFKFIVLSQIVSIIMKDKINRHDLFGLQCIIGGILLRSSLFTISFYFFLGFKIISLFYSKYKLNTIILYLLSIFFFHQIPIINLFLFKLTRWILMINFFIVLSLLLFPNILNLYTNFMISILNTIPYLSFNHTISILIFIIIILMIVFIKSKKMKILIYILLLYPNSWKFYQEIIFIPTYNDLIIIQKPNFFQKPIIYSKLPISQYYLNLYGINEYDIDDINTKKKEDNYLIYFNDVFYIGNYFFETYPNLSVDYYITKKINDDIIKKNDIKKVLLFGGNDKYGNEELKLLEMKKEYFNTNKTVKFMYFFNQKVIIK